MKRSFAQLVSIFMALIVVICLVPTSSIADKRAVSIKVFNQPSYTSSSDSRWALAKKDSESNRDLASAGCGLFAYAHAIQWLTQTQRDDGILTELISVCSDPNGNRSHRNCSHTNKSDVYFLAYRNYIRSQYGLTNSSFSIRNASESSIKSEFDGGYVFVFMIHWSGGGHVILATDYTVIGGTTYIQVVDSSAGASTRYSSRPYYNATYTYNGTTMTKNGATLSGGQSYWITLSKFKSTADSPYKIGGGSWQGHSSNDVPPTSIQLTSNNEVLYLNGQGVTLSATAYPSNSNQNVAWTTSSSSIVTVSNGVVTPVGLGTATVTATSTIDPSIKATCQVEVRYNGTGSIQFSSVIFPYRFKVNNGGFKWESNSGTISSDVNLTYVVFSITHPNGNTYNYRYPSDTSATIGSKTLAMSSCSSIIKFSQVTSTGNGYFQIEVHDSAGRSMTVGRIFTASTSTGVNKSSDSTCSNAQYRIDTTYQDPVLMDTVTLNGHTYHRYKASYTWTEARTYAQNIGGHLATISSADENAIIYSLVKKDSNYGAWIGGYRASGSWAWVTGEPFSYSNWYTADGEPDNQWGIENYIGMRITEGMWRDSANNNYNWRYFIVEFEPRPVANILLSGESSPFVDDTFTMAATVLPTDAYNRQIVFTSSNTSIATVNASTGLVTTKSEGEVTITATAQDGSGVTGSYTLYVQHQPIHVTGVTISADRSLYTDTNTVTVKKGDTFTLSSTISPSNTDYTGVTYYSTDVNIAVVEDYANTVTALEEGTCELVVVTDDGAYESRLTLIVLPTSGSCGDNATWSYSNGTLAISGSGAMTNYASAEEQPWGSSRTNITQIVITDGVESIGNYAFHGFTQLVSVDLPSSLISVGYRAFRLCSAMETITLPSGVNHIGSGAFDGCYSLISFEIPHGITEIYPRTFHNCSLITRYEIPDGVTSIGSWAFINNYALREIIIPASVTTIADDAFENDDNLTISCYAGTTAHLYAKANAIPYTLLDTALPTADFTTPAMLRTIEAEAFSGVPARVVRLAATTTAIGSRAFANCPNLVCVYIPAGCTNIATDAFSGVENLVIFTPVGSYAEYYASRFGYECVNVTN